MIGIKHDRAAAQRIAVRIGVAGALALAAGASSREWLARDHPAPPEAMAAVLVAARAIVPGASLTAADLHWQAWPARGVPIGAMVLAAPAPLR